MVRVVQDVHTLQEYHELKLMRALLDRTMHVCVEVVGLRALYSREGMASVLSNIFILRGMAFVACTPALIEFCDWRSQYFHVVGGNGLGFCSRCCFVWCCTGELGNLS